MINFRVFANFYLNSASITQEELQLERAAKDEVCLQLTEVQSQLQLAEEAWRAGEAEGRRLRENLEDREAEGRQLRESLEDREAEGRQLRESLEDREAEGRQLRESLEEREAELGVAREVARRADEVCREREGELGRLEAHLSSLETDNREQVREMGSAGAACTVHVCVHYCTLHKFIYDTNYITLKVYIHFSLCTCPVYLLCRGSTTASC